MFIIVTRAGHTCRAEVETFQVVRVSHITVDSMPAASLGVEPHLGPMINFEPSLDRSIAVTAEFSIRLWENVIA